MRTASSSSPNGMTPSDELLGQQFDGVGLAEVRGPAHLSQVVASDVRRREWSSAMVVALTPERRWPESCSHATVRAMISRAGGVASHDGRLLPNVPVHLADDLVMGVGDVVDRPMEEPAQSVAKPLGSTTMTRTPKCAVPTASTRLMPSPANPAAGWEATPGVPPTLPPERGEMHDGPSLPARVGNAPLLVC